MAAVGTLTIEMAANVARLQRDMDRATKTVGGAMDRIQRSVQGATRAFGLLTAAFASYKAVQGILQQADAMTQLNSRLQLVTRTQEEFVKTQASLISIAQRSYTSLGATVDLYTALARSTREVGVSQNELLRVVETFNKSIIISGGSVQAAEAAITQFNQAMASGVLRGEEFNSISEQAPMIMELLANSLGVTRGALRDMAKEGLLVAELVLPALIEGSQGVDEQFAQMNKTVGQAGQQMKNSFMLFLDELNRGQDITSTFAGAIDAVTSGLDYLTRLLRASQGDLSDYIDTQAESAKFARQQAEALKGQEEAVKSRARALLEQKERDELAKKAADELKKSYDKLLETLKSDIRGSTAALQAEQQGLNNAQEEFLKLVSGPQWRQYTEAQRMLVTDLFKQRIETEKLIDAEKARAKAAEARLKKMLDDEKDFRDELAKEDKKAEEDRIKAQEKLYEEHRKEIEKVGDQLTDALMRAFESGKGFGQAFKDTLVNMFRTMVLRPILAPISGAFAGAFSPSAIAGGAGGMGGGAGFLGGIAAASGALGTGLAAGFTNALTGTFAGSLQAAGSLIGTGTMSGVAAGAGMAIGTVLPYAAAAVAVYKLLQGDGKDPTGRGAFFSTRGADITRGLVAETTGFKTSSEVVNDFFDRANDGLKPVVETVVTGILDTTQARARAIGLDIALGIDAGLVTDPEAKQSYGYASIFMGGERISNIVERSLGRDFEQATAKFSQILQEEVAQAILDAGDIMVPAGQTASQVLERLGSSILAVNNTFETLGLSLYETSIAGAEMAAALVDLLGGVENFTQLSAQYYQNFYTEAERTQILMNQISGSFNDLGLSLPGTRDAFRAIVEAQDLSTESGRQLFAALMKLSPAFDQFMTGAEASLQQALAVADEQRARMEAIQAEEAAALAQQIQTAFSDANAATNLALSAVQRAIDAQKESLELSAEIAEEQVDNIQSVFDVLNNAILDLTGGGFTAITGQAFIQQALLAAQTSGYLPDPNELSRAISAVRGGLTGGSFGSAFEARREQALFVARLTQLREFAGDQLSTAEQTLNGINLQIAQLDEQLIAAQEQVNVLRGIDTGIRDIPTSIAALQTSISNELTALRELQAQQAKVAVPVVPPTPTPTPTPSVSLNTAGLSQMGPFAPTYGSNSITINRPAGQTGSTQTITIGGKKVDLLTLDPFAYTVKGFAAGGMHQGGMRMVGERGPELEVTGPARYLSNSNLSTIMNGDKEEIRALREDNRVQMRSMISLQNRMTKLLERWDGDGLPEERVVT